MSDRVVVPVVFDVNSGELRTAEGALIRVGGAADGAARGGISRLRTGLNALGATTALAVLTALYGALRAVGQGVRDAGVNAILDRRLGQALRNLGADAEAGVAGINQTADRIEHLTGVEAEQTKAAAAMLATFRSVGGTEGIQMLLPRLADMAAGTANAAGEMADLTSVAAQVGKALENGGTSLRRYGVSLTEAQEAQIKAASGMERVELLAAVLDSNFRGLAEAAADPLKVTTAAVGNLAEEAGGPLREALAEAAVRVTDLARDPGIIRMARAVGAGLGWLATTALRSIGAIQRGFIRLQIAGRETVNSIVGTVTDGVGALAEFQGRMTAFFEGINPESLVSRAGRSINEGLDGATAAAERYLQRHAGITARLQVRLRELEDTAEQTETRVAQARDLAAVLADAEREAEAETEGAARRRLAAARRERTAEERERRRRTEQAFRDREIEIEAMADGFAKQEATIRLGFDRQREAYVREYGAMSAAVRAKFSRAEETAIFEAITAPIDVATMTVGRKLAQSAEAIRAWQQATQQTLTQFDPVAPDMEPPPLPFEAWELAMERGALDTIHRADEALQGLGHALANASSDERRQEIARLIAEIERLKDGMEKAARVAPTLGEGIALGAGVAGDAFGALAANAQTSYQIAQDEARATGANAEQAGRKAFEAYKRFAIAQAIIDTLASANAAYKAMAGIPGVGPALGYAAAAAALVAGYARVRAIRAQQPGGGSSGGGSVGSGPGASSVSGGLALGATLNPAGGGAPRGSAPAPVFNPTIVNQPPTVNLYADDRLIATSANTGNARITRLNGAPSRRD